MVNDRLKSNIMQVVNNQIRSGKPESTRGTYERLMSLGYSQGEVKEMIAVVLLEEMYDVMKNQELFNENRYSKKLALLPDYTREDNEEEFAENINDEIMQMPIRNEQKIGRNDPCPCGSGKKYKKCCGKNI